MAEKFLFNLYQHFAELKYIFKVILQDKTKEFSI